MPVRSSRPGRLWASTRSPPRSRPLRSKHRSPSDDLGCVLLDGSGHVPGMLEMIRGSGPSTMAVFLPAELVIGVARQLVISGTVEHGWLGVETSNAAPTTTHTHGAVVTAVGGQPTAPGWTRSPATVRPRTRGSVPGDIITAIDGSRVQSTAELRSRLYADPPGSSLSLTIQRGLVHPDDVGGPGRRRTPLHREMTPRRSMTAWHRQNQGIRETRSSHLLGDLMNMLGTNAPNQWEMTRSFALNVATGGAPRPTSSPSRGSGSSSWPGWQSSM